jgi:hypothetical protein
MDPIPSPAGTTKNPNVELCQRTRPWQPIFPKVPVEGFKKYRMKYVEGRLGKLLGKMAANTKV